MKKIFRTTANEIRRILCSSGFWLSSALALIILFTTTAYKETDGTAYNIFSAGFIFDKQALLDNGITVQTLFSTTVRYALPMYGPLLAALAFASILCEEQKYGVRRYLLFKEGKKSYVFSKALSAIITSGLVFLISALVLLLFIYWKYPLMSAHDADGFAYWLDFNSKNPDGTTMVMFQWFGEHAYCLLQLIGVFVYGVFCGFVGYICTAFFSNVYLAVCIPFFFGYIYYSITQAIMGRAIEGSVPMELYTAINTYVSPEGYMLFWRMRDGLVINSIVLVAVWVIAIVIHMFRIEKATDCGVNR